MSPVRLLLLCTLQTASATEKRTTPYASKRDWNQVDRAIQEELEKEKPEGEEALNEVGGHPPWAVGLAVSISAVCCHMKTFLLILHAPPLPNSFSEASMPRPMRIRDAP